MPSSPSPLVHRLAAFEQQVRQRLDRAANRLEDNDPIDLLGLRSAVKVLDAIDRLTGFRATHRKATQARFEPHVTISPPGVVGMRPELGGLKDLHAADRGRLTARYRAWVKVLSRHADKPLTVDTADGGHPLSQSALMSITPVWQSWRDEVDRLKQ